MKKEGEEKGNKGLSGDGISRSDQLRDPISNSPSDKQHTLKQSANRELNERNTSADEADRINDMRETEIEDEDRNPNIFPDDPIEAEQTESEKLRFGFSFEPKEGQMGDETEDEGDLTAEQRKPGNRYRPYLGVDDGEKDDETRANDQELHITDTGHIGMSFGEDNYTEEEEEEPPK